MDVSQVREHQIRMSLLSLLRDRHGADPATLIRQELGLCAGSRRVDVAVINGELAGFEIKSDQDTLDRLAGQAAIYGQVLDRVTLITTDRYLERAAALVPDWWGLMRACHVGVCAVPVERDGVAEQEAGTARAVVFTQVRPATGNTGQDPFAVAQLLWRDEALMILRARGLHHGLQRKRRWIIWRYLAEAVPLADLQHLVRDQLRARRAWPGGR
jgi:hypothetical protein